MHRQPHILLHILVCFILTCLGCAPMTYNRYQTAHTLGKWEMKLAVSANMSRDPIFQAWNELAGEMDREFLGWAQHKDLERQYIDAVLEANENIDETAMYSSDAGFIPDCELIYAIGVHDRVDLELRSTISGYYRLNSKILIAELGPHGGLSIAPGIGYRAIHTFRFHTSYKPEDNIEISDDFSGWAMTAEVPLIIGWRFSHVSPYMAPMYAYHYLNVDYTRRTDHLHPEFERTLQYDLHFHQVGLIAGVQFSFWHIIITPEIAGIFHTGPGVDVLALYPGIALGAFW